MDCPRDGSSLTILHHEHQAYEGCTACGGYFLEPQLLHESLGLNTQELAERVSDTELPVSSLLCPKDRQPMRALVYEEVEIDLCPACAGVWLDAGELDAILARRGREQPDDGDGLSDYLDIDIDVDVDSAPESNSAGSSGPNDIGADAADEAGSVIGDALEFVGSAIGSLFDGL